MNVSGLDSINACFCVKVHDALRLPGIVACSANRETLALLCDLAKDWEPVRYRHG